MTPTAQVLQRWRRYHAMKNPRESGFFYACDTA